jgi:hypothetical protein
MEKRYFTQETRLAEARPDLMSILQRLSSSPEEDTPFANLTDSPLAPALVRDTMMVSNTSEIDEAEAESVILGVRKLLSEIQSRIVVAYSGDTAIQGDDFGDPDWYQQQCLMEREQGFGKQVSANKLDHLLRIEPQQQKQPHFDLMILDGDLTTAFLGNDFVYGAVRYPNSLLSVCRLRGAFSDYRLYKSVLSLISAQHMARLTGFPRRNFNEKRGRPYNGYCNGEKGPCLLEPLKFTGPDAEQRVSGIAGQVNWLCDDCLEEAEFRRKDLQAKEMIW